MDKSTKINIIIMVVIFIIILVISAFLTEYLDDIFVSNIMTIAIRFLSTVGTIIALRTIIKKRK